MLVMIDMANPQVVELSAQNVVIDSFLDTQSRANSLKWFTKIYAYLTRYGQRVSCTVSFWPWLLLFLS